MKIGHIARVFLDDGNLDFASDVAIVSLHGFLVRIGVGSNEKVTVQILGHDDTVIEVDAEGAVTSSVRLKDLGPGASEFQFARQRLS